MPELWICSIITYDSNRKTVKGKREVQNLALDILVLHNGHKRRKETETETEKKKG